MFKSRVLSSVVAFAQLTRLYMSLVLGMSAIAGLRLSAPHGTSVWAQSLLFAVGVMTAAGGFALNDLQDRDRDRLSRAKPLVRGDMRPSVAAWTSGVLLCSALLLSIVLGPKWLGISIVQIALLITYSKIKRFNGVYANLVTAILCASGVMYGGLLGNWSGPLLSLIAASFLLVLGREMLKDVLDLEDDQVAMIVTLPIMCGAKRSTRVSAVLGVGAIFIAGLGLRSVFVGPIALIAELALIATGVCFLWNAHMLTKSSLSYTLHVSAGAMLLILVTSSLPT